MAESELETKQVRLNSFLDRHKLDGVILWHRNNFAWITCGGDNHVVNSTPVGFAAILATREKRVCLANSIEAPRFKLEELVDKGIEVIDFPWWDAAATKKVVGEVLGKRKVATDADDFGLGLAALPGDFAELRWSLTGPEIERYRDGCRKAALALEKACRKLKPGMSEFEVAGIIDCHVRDTGSKPVVTLVAADERAEKFRHAIPTGHKIRKHVMCVTCAEGSGMIANLTRWVHFGPIPSDLQTKQQSICNIDAAVNLATRPGRTFGEIFTDLQSAYEREGWPDQWKLHHQGGSTGYAGREALGMPGSPIKVLENQAFAWNPSIVAAKSEDTVLVTSKGIEVLTAHSGDWPTVEGRAGDRVLPRAGILEV